MIATDRQCHCCRLYLQTGWDPFPHPVAAGSGSISVATISRYSPSLPDTFHISDSRPVISAEPAHHDRVEPPPRSSESNIQTIGNSSSGHVCHSPQCTSSPVYVSSSGARSTDDRCTVTGVAGKVDIHVSTVCPAHQSHSEAQDDPGGRGDTHSPLVAVTTVVSTLATIVYGLPSILSVTYCHNRDMSQAASCTICTHGGSHASLPSSRIFEGGL